MTKTIESTIVSIEVQHREGGKGFPRPYRKGGTYVPAHVTIWAYTEAGDRVWLRSTRTWSSDRIERKVSKFEEKYLILVGHNIEYVIKPSEFTLGDIAFVRKIDGEKYWHVGDSDL